MGLGWVWLGSVGLGIGLGRSGGEKRREVEGRKRNGGTGWDVETYRLDARPRLRRTSLLEAREDSPGFFRQPQMIHFLDSGMCG